MMAAGLRGILASAGAWAREARGNPLFLRGLAGAAALATFDRLTKLWVVEGLRLPEQPGGRIEVLPFFDLTYVENTGMSFGLLAGAASSRIFLSILSVAIALALVVWLGRVRRSLLAAGLALIIGGAVGNLIDRAAFGYVIDFLDFSGLYFPWVFNVADAAINIGLAVLVFDWWREGREKAGAEGS
jgi:signal peptidase II